MRCPAGGRFRTRKPPRRGTFECAESQRSGCVSLEGRQPLLWKTGLPSLGDFEISLGDSFPFFGRQVTFLWERDFPSPKEKCRATGTISRASKRKDGQGRTPRPSVYAAKSAVFSRFFRVLSVRSAGGAAIRSVVRRWADAVCGDWARRICRTSPSG